MAGSRTVETITARERMEIGDRPPFAHIADPGMNVALCGFTGTRKRPPTWDGSYCVVCLEINGGPPNWWLHGNEAAS